MKKTVIFVALLAAFLFSGCEKQTYRYQKSFVGAFDTVITITGFAQNNSEFEKKATEIYNLLSEYSELYDIYSDYEGINNIKTINDNRGKAPVAVDSRIIDLLTFADEIYSLTDGNTNIAMGSVLSIWHEKREEALDNPECASLPDSNMLTEASYCTDIEKIVIDRENNTVFIDDENVMLDVGAIAKGFAVECVAEKLEADGASGYSINAGGNIRTVGNKPDGGMWAVGIQNPSSETEYSSVVNIYGGKSVVTSGSYQRFFTVNGKNYNHIIDPKTLYPAEYYSSVTVIADDSGIADALSTAFFIMNIEDGKKLAESLDGVEVYWITQDGKTYETEGFSEFK